MKAERLEISMARPRLEADPADVADLILGFTATMSVTRGSFRWSDEYFPVLELACQATRHDDWGRAFVFNSMSLEEEPAFAVFPNGPSYVIALFDGASISAEKDEIRPAIGSFVREVDVALQSLTGRKILGLVEELGGSSATP